MRHGGGERFRLDLRALDGEAPAVVRLRRMLKALYRTYGLVCTSVTELKPADKPDDKRNEEKV